MRSAKTASTRSSLVGKRRNMVAIPTPASRATDAMEAFRPSRANTSRAAAMIRSRLRSASLRRGWAAVLSGVSGLPGFMPPSLTIGLTYPFLVLRWQRANRIGLSGS